MDDQNRSARPGTVLADTDAVTGSPDGDETDRRSVYRLFGREFPRPGSRRARLALGIALSVLGVFGFLPVLGFWMIPLGLFILSHEIHPLRRIRRRLTVRRGRRKARASGQR